MKPSERLAEIETHEVIGLDNLFWNDRKWLIARVKTLEHALEQYKYIVSNGIDAGVIARKALEGDE